MIDLEAIKARADAATPGPWNQWAGEGWPQSWANRLGMPGGGVAWGIAGPDDAIAANGTPGRYLAIARRSQDQAFIAHARTDVPALVAEVERLRALNGELTTALRLSEQEADEIVAWCGANHG